MLECPTISSNVNYVKFITVYIYMTFMRTDGVLALTMNMYHTKYNKYTHYN